MFSIFGNKSCLDNKPEQESNLNLCATYSIFTRKGTGRKYKFGAKWFRGQFCMRKGLPQIDNISLYILCKWVYLLKEKGTFRCRKGLRTCPQCFPGSYAHVYWSNPAPHNLRGVTFHPHLTVRLKDCYQWPFTREITRCYVIVIFQVWEHFVTLCHIFLSDRINLLLRR